MNQLDNFKEYLKREEKSTATTEKYLRDCRAFLIFAEDQPVTKNLTAAYKQSLIARGLRPSSVNSMLAALNCYLRFMQLEELQVKPLRIQRKTYCTESSQLTRSEYEKLLCASESKPRLHLAMQTICSTGIRVSELRWFTIEAVRTGEITLQNKGKTRTILIPGKLRKKLLNYAAMQGMTSGVIFRTKSGKPLDRSNLWRAMKQICKNTGIAAEKVFPHNLRKLFARMFYKAEKDIAKLADILGHGSIETTRIYIMTTSREHLQKIERLGLVV